MEIKTPSTEMAHLPLSTFLLTKDHLSTHPLLKHALTILPLTITFSEAQWRFNKTDRLPLSVPELSPMASLSWKTLPPLPSSFIYSPTSLFPHQQTYPFSHSSSSLSLSSKLSMAYQQTPQSSFQDLLPTMADKLGGDGLIGELCNGFNLLMDSNKGAITFESLKRNSALLGLQDLSDDDLRSMLDEGDFDGDGALNQMEFCVLMFRLSPELMDESRLWLEDALQQEFKHCY